MKKEKAVLILAYSALTDLDLQEDGNGLTEYDMELLEAILTVSVVGNRCYTFYTQKVDKLFQNTTKYLDVDSFEKENKKSYFRIEKKLEELKKRFPIEE